jgi:prefoldin subunit 5
MTYDWEQEAVKSVLSEVRQANLELDERFEILGVAVANAETGEACFLPLVPVDGSIFLADCLKDIKGDVDNLYEKSVNEAFGMFL